MDFIAAQANATARRSTTPGWGGFVPGAGAQVRELAIHHGFNVDMTAGVSPSPARRTVGRAAIQPPAAEQAPAWRLPWVDLPFNLPLISEWGKGGTAPVRGPDVRLNGLGLGEEDLSVYTLPESYYDEPAASRASGGYGAAAGAYGGQAAAQILTGPGDITQRLVISAPQIFAAGVSTAAMLGSTWAAAAIPIIGPIVVGVTLGLTALFSRKGPRQKLATTAIVDQVEPLLQENVQGYLSGPRTQTSQAQAIQNFYAGWQWVLDHCAIPEMGDPGVRCVTERQEGARPAWGQNWFQLYLDPIRNDTQVKSDLVAATGSIGETFGISTPAGGGLMETTVGGLPAPLLIAAGLALVFLMGGSKS
jgi:hypothetical protein